LVELQEIVVELPDKISESVTFKSIVIGIIGGVNIFGAIGLFLGPIIFSMLLVYFESFKETFI